MKIKQAKTDKKTRDILLRLLRAGGHLTAQYLYPVTSLIDKDNICNPGVTAMDSNTGAWAHVHFSNCLSAAIVETREGGDELVTIYISSVGLPAIIQMLLTIAAAPKLQENIWRKALASEWAADGFYTKQNLKGYIAEQLPEVTISLQNIHRIIDLLCSALPITFNWKTTPKPPVVS